MRIGPYQFRPSPVPTLVTLLLLPLLLGLGVWQLDRAEQKREIIRSRERGATASTVDLNAGQPPFDAVRHRPAMASGRYDAEHQFLLDNQIHNGRAGYHVITPLRLPNGGAVLVDRGWVAAPPRRTELPAVAVDERLRTVRGRIDDGPSVGMRMGEPVSEPRWPRRMAYMDFAYMAKALPYRLRAAYLIQLAPGAADGYARDWTQPAEFGPRRHVGYAVQWFALAAALVLIYLVVNLKRTDR